MACSGATGPNRLRVGEMGACRVFRVAVPRASGVRLSGRVGQAVVGELGRPAILPARPQVMGTPGLVSECGLKTTATVWAVFRGFIPFPREDRIQPVRLGGNYRLERRCQRVIQWQWAVTRPSAQSRFAESLRDGSPALTARVKSAVLTNKCRLEGRFGKPKPPPAHELVAGSGRCEEGTKKKW